MAVAMQAQQRDVAGALKRIVDSVERLIGDAFPGCQQIIRNEIVLQQIVARCITEAFDIKHRPVAERAAPADGVDAADEAAQPFAHARLVEFRRPAALAREDGEAETAVLVQGRSAEL